MKKLVLASLLASVSTLAFAGTGVYVQGDVGYSKVTAKDTATHKDTDKAIKLSAGKDLGALRWVVDYTTYGSANTKESSVVHGSWNIYTTVSQYDSIIKHKIQSVGASAFYDFEGVLGHNLTPYVGVRAGLNEIKAVTMTTANTHYSNAELQEEFDQVAPQTEVDKKTKFGGGVQAGVHYAINQNLGLDLSVEYNHLGKIKGTKFTQQGAKLGVRYTF